MIRPSVKLHDVNCVNETKHADNLCNKLSNSDLSPGGKKNKINNNNKNDPPVLKKNVFFFLFLQNDFFGCQKIKYSKLLHECL